MNYNIDAIDQLDSPALVIYPELVRQCSWVDTSISTRRRTLLSLMRQSMPNSVAIMRPVRRPSLAVRETLMEPLPAELPKNGAAGHRLRPRLPPGPGPGHDRTTAA